MFEKPYDGCNVNCLGVLLQTSLRRNKTQNKTSDYIKTQAYQSRLCVYIQQFFVYCMCGTLG